jgi:hypothetical protein
VIDEQALLVFVNEALVARFLDEFGHAVQGPVQRHALPAVRVRLAVQDILLAMRVHRQLKGVRSLWAERTFVDGAVRVPFHIDELAALRVNILAAPDRAIRADRVSQRRAFEPGTFVEVEAAVRLSGSAIRLVVREKGQPEHGISGEKRTLMSHQSRW